MDDEEAKKYAAGFPPFLRISKDDVTLKFVFDNIRNFGLASALFYFGIQLFKDGFVGSISLIPYASEVFGIVTMISAFFLAIFNYLQSCMALFMWRKWATAPFMVVALALHVVLIEFFFRFALPAGG